MSSGKKLEITKEIKEKIIKTKLFDEEYYLSNFSEKIDNPLEHYLEIGYKEGYNPSSEFDTNNYLKNNVDVKEAGLNPLAHYVTFKNNDKRRVKYDLNLADYRKFRKIVYSEGLFDDEYYLSQVNSEVKDALDHYMSEGYEKGLNPSPLFSTNNYLKNNPDVKQAGKNPLQHYVFYALNNYRKVNHNLSLPQLKEFRKKAYQKYMFDDEYYLSQVTDKNIIDPLEHYLNIGYKEGLNPSEYFEMECYIKNNQNILENEELNPFIDYVLNRLDDNRKTKFDLTVDEYKKFKENVYKNQLFDDEYYYKHVKEELNNPLDHYINKGAQEGLNPSDNFDTNCYLKNNPKAANSNLNPLVYYVMYDEDKQSKVKYDLTPENYQLFKHILEKEELFDKDYYISQYPENTVDYPLDHYMSIGWKENKNPSPIFDTKKYLEYNKDVLNSEMNPFIHFILYGLDSNRKFNFDLSYNQYKDFKRTVSEKKLFDEEYYRSQYEKTLINPLADYLSIGWKEGKNPSYLFDTRKYLEYNPDVKKAGMNPLLHFVLYGIESKRKFNFDYTYKEYQEFKEKVYENLLIDDVYYQSQCKTNIIDALSHYLTTGYIQGINPSYLFDTNEYIEKSNFKKGNILDHVLKHGFNSNIRFIFDLSYKEYMHFKQKVYNEGFFDDEYYLTLNPTIKTSQPLEHYLRVGYKEGLNPSKYFDTNCYLENSRDVANLGLNPLIHYIQQSFDSARKVKCDLSFSKYQKFREIIYSEGLFNDEYYLRQFKNSKIIDPVDHYMMKGWKDNKDPSPLFSTSEYLKVNWDVAESNVNPLQHFVTYAMDKPRHFNFGFSYKNFKKFKTIALEEKLFDEEYYLKQCDEEDIIDPLCHYLSIGSKNGYDPSKYFSTKQYLKKYRDVEEDGRNPLIHYCIYGLEEDRLIKFNLTLSEIKKFYEQAYTTELFDEEYYLKQCDETDIEYPLDHYVEIGSYENKNPSIYFDSENYLENNPDVFYLNKNPLVHYIIYAYNSNRRVNHNLTLQLYKKFRQFVYEEGLFDDEYYLSQLDDDENVPDSLEHYLNIGYKEGLNPSDKFNTVKYIQEHENLKKDENPLIHYTTNIIEAYDTISNSDIFNEEFYYSHSEEVEIDESEDPIMHYITKGVDLDLNPSAFFSTSKYYEAYPDVKESGLNPLYHFIKYGRRQSRDSFMVLSTHLQKFEDRYRIHSCTNMLKALEKTVSIIIPIYNAYEETKDCITSVLRNTHINYELILINDSSTDERINELLKSLEIVPNIKIINNNVNQGFVKNVNMGMSISEHDVVLLNSDTIVTPHWLSHLVYCAYSSNEIGTVTPFSNASDISIPEVESKKDFYYINKTGYHLDRLAYNLNMEAPTGNGFCLFIKRELINEIGLFDEAFGMGYGEETDFTYRAYKQGWLNIRDEAVFVYHRRHASFNEENSNSLKVENKKLLMARHGEELFDLWDEFVHSESLTDALYRIKLHINDRKNPERILYVTNMIKDEPVLDKDYTILSEEYECFILILTGKQLKLGVLREGRFVLYNRWFIDSKWDQNKFVKLYLNILLNLKIDLLYVKYIYNFYNPNNQNLSVFIKLLSKFEIPVLYEATTEHEELLNNVFELLYPMSSLKDLVKEKSEEIDFDKHKLVVYTALTGNYDELVTPSVRNPKFDYICFTDNPDLKSNFWKIVPMEDLELDSIRKARHYKILPHKYLKKYDYSLWIDANFDIIGDIEEYVNKYSKNHKLLAIKHDLRDDIYEEAQACIELEKDDPDLINRQVSRYRENDYPEHNGLIASGILFRKHNDQQIIRIMTDWYSEVYNYSRRDQLSFNYVCWKHNFKYDESKEFYFKNQYFQRLYHIQDNLLKLPYNGEVVDRILDSFKDKTSIIIPIYNAYEETKACIESVQKYTTIPYELVLIDDCSTDERIRELLLGLEKEYDNIKVVLNEENKGFVKNINIGFEKTSDDVVILNSDTEVTPKWLQKLKITAYMKDNIATVTPFSNNAGAFSVPVHDEDNEIDEDLGVNSTANIIEKIDTKDKLYVPTGNGFCMYIRRKAIYDVGFFDLIFGRGYCEENDFCMRLLQKGWTHAIDTSTYILHKHNVSFSSEKEELYEKNRELLDELYPDYSLKLLDLLRSYDFKDIRDKIALTLECESNHKFDTKRILYLIHEGNGGTLHTSIELMRNLPCNVESYILTAGKTHIKLYKHTKVGNNVSDDEDNEFLQYLNLMASWEIKDEYSISNIFNNEFRRIYFNILYTLKIDLVHIRHLIRHSFDMPYVAKLLGIPVILSFHDFYYICPSHNLVDDNEVYCGGHCSEVYSNRGQCDISDGLNAPILKTYVSTWRENVQKMFECCDAFVTTSKSAYDLYTEFYPDLTDKKFIIIEHGRDIKTPDVARNDIKLSKPIRILFPGHINVNKGGWLIKAIKECDTDNKLEFHYMGNIHSKFKLEDIGVHHGYYKRSEFCKKVNEIKPHFIGLLSIWPETYCHTLTESWGCGVPVITLDVGALGERVHKNGGGFFIENNPQKAYDKIIEISHDSRMYKEMLEDITSINFKTTAEMAQEYMELYKKYLSIDE